MIENADEELSINLIYGNTVKITPWTFFTSQYDIFFEKLQERYKLWEIDDCACKPKKIRIQHFDFANLQYTTNMLLRTSNINDVKVGIYIDKNNNDRSFSKYDTMIFNNSSRRMSDKKINFILTGDTLAVVYEGKYYNFRLDQRTKESEDSHIKGKI